MVAKPRLLELVRSAAKVRGYSEATADAYTRWVVEYVRYCGMTHPLELGAEHVLRFLEHVAADRAASTVNQAHAALGFLYRAVLRRVPEGLDDVPWARGPKRVPVVLSRGEVRRLLAATRGRHELVARLLYGCGLRLREATGLRVKDLCLDAKRVEVRKGKRAKDRVIPMPRTLVGTLREHLAVLRAGHEQDLRAGAGAVWLPGRFAMKAPSAAWDWPWQWVFPSTRLARLEGRSIGRWPMHASSVQKALRSAGRRAEIAKRVHPHALRHSFAAHLVEAGCDIRTLQKLLGHTDIRTTMVYLESWDAERQGVVSPLDRLGEDGEE